MHMSLVTLAGVVLAAALSFAGCDDGGDDDFDSRNAGGLDNGERCMITGSTAAVCSGNRCLTFGTGAQFGACTEQCVTGCAHGGTCVSSESQGGRFCVVECDSGNDCAEGFGCIEGSDFEVCTGEFDCAPEAGRTWCLPLPQ